MASAAAFPDLLRPSTACLLAASLALTACGTATPADPDANPAAGSADAALDNCGIGIPVQEPPKAVFAAYQPAIEMAHALGLSDRLVGTAFLDAVVMEKHAAAQEDQLYFEQNPSREELLGLEPDFVLSGYNGVFTEESFGTRSSLHDLGVNTWIFSPLCPSEDGLTDETIDPADVTMDNVYADLRDLGTLFDAQDTAEEVIDDMQATLDEVAHTVAEVEEPPTVLIARPSDEGFRASGGPDFGTEIIKLAGGVNAAEDLDEARNVDVSTEALIERDPDFILVDVCCDAEMTAADAADDVAAIMDDPALANLTAVTEGQVLEFTFADRAASVRSADSVALVAELIHPDLFG